jgi:hypothetical protein
MLHTPFQTQLAAMSELRDKQRGLCYLMCQVQWFSFLIAIPYKVAATNLAQTCNKEEKHCCKDFHIISFMHVSTKRQDGSVLLDRRSMSEAINASYSTQHDSLLTPGLNAVASTDNNYSPSNRICYLPLLL